MHENNVCRYVHTKYETYAKKTKYPSNNIRIGFLLCKEKQSSPFFV
jgi:hypothetical protein